MNTYYVEVKEILSKVVKIKAYSENQAESQVKNLYWDGDLKLTPEENCIGYSVNCVRSEETDQPELFSDGDL